MQYRLATPGDTQALAQVFFRSIREGPAPYTQAQRAARAPYVPDTERFGARLAAQTVFIVRDVKTIVGFTSMAQDGYVDLVFILPAFRGRGIFRTLLERLETQARTQGIAWLWTHASLMAQPAFQASGFSVIQHEMVTCASETLARAEMGKQLK